MFGRLYIEERGHPERIVELRDATTIGRATDNDIVLKSDGISRSHVLLLPAPGGVTLLDLGSTFGTFVDSVQALPDEPVHLSDGARINIGRAVLRYAAPSAAERPVPARLGLPTRLEAPHLNTRFVGLGPEEAVPVGRHVALLVWVGAPLPGDQHQSSRPLGQVGADLATPVALNVRVRSASIGWTVLAEEPVVLAAEWGSARI